MLPYSSLCIISASVSSARCAGRLAYPFQYDPVKGLVSPIRSGSRVTRLRRDSRTNTPRGQHRTMDGAARATSSGPSSRRPERPSPGPTRGAPSRTGWTSWARWKRGSRRRWRRSMPSWTISTCIGPPMCCSSAWPTPALEFVFQPKYAAYLTLIEPWWKICGLWRSKAAGLRVGRRSPRLSKQPPHTGTSIAIPSFGAAGGVIAPVALASPTCRKQPDLVDAPLSLNHKNQLSCGTS